MSKFLFSLWIIILAAACNSAVQDQQGDSESPEDISQTDMPKLVEIRPEARELLDGWPEYMSLENRIQAVQEARDTEELQLLVEELRQICQQLEDNDFPEVFDTPSVRSRLKVLRTYLGKLDAALFYRTDYIEPRTELMGSYNALRQQYNVLVSSTLTPDMFENDTIPDTE